MDCWFGVLLLGHFRFPRFWMRASLFNAPGSQMATLRVYGQKAVGEFRMHVAGTAYFRRPLLELKSFLPTKPPAARRTPLSNLLPSATLVNLFMKLNRVA
jgi:hypothetical protein